MVNLSEYFPAGPITHQYKSFGGANSAKYTFQKEPAGFLNLYNNYLSQGKPGYHYTWRKEYWRDSAWCRRTYAVLFMGEDLSVTECGDWLACDNGCTPNTAFGYKTALSGGANTGLIWCPPGGLSETPHVNEMFTCSQTAPGAPYQTSGHKAYSKVGLIEHLDTYTPPYGANSLGVWGPGNAKTYEDVVHLVMYHGTRYPTPAPVRCEMVSPVSAHGVYYQSYKDFNSYAMELWIARGVGIIQEDTPFIENGAPFGIPNCNGTIFSTPYSWSKFIY